MAEGRQRTLNYHDARRFVPGLLQRILKVAEAPRVATRRLALGRNGPDRRRVDGDNQDPTEGSGSGRQSESPQGECFSDNDGEKTRRRRPSSGGGGWPWPAHAKEDPPPRAKCSDRALLVEPLTDSPCVPLWSSAGKFQKGSKGGAGGWQARFITECTQNSGTAN